jgi:osmotically inducible lipoprotein OsmB
MARGARGVHALNIDDSIREIAMKSSFTRLAALAALAASMAACSSMDHRTRDTAVGAAVGGVAGSVLSGGSTAGTVGGAVAGGVIGSERARRR